MTCALALSSARRIMQTDGWIDDLAYAPALYRGNAAGQAAHDEPPGTTVPIEEPALPQSGAALPVIGPTLPLAGPTLAVEGASMARKAPALRL
jgi:hypothetical protein